MLLENLADGERLSPRGDRLEHVRVEPGLHQLLPQQRDHLLEATHLSGAADLGRGRGHGGRRPLTIRQLESKIRKQTVRRYQADHRRHIAELKRLITEPLMPLAIFRAANLGAANLAQALLGAAWIPMWFFLNLYLQQVLGYGAFEGGAALPYEAQWVNNARRTYAGQPARADVLAWRWRASKAGMVIEAVAGDQAGDQRLGVGGGGVAQAEPPLLRV